VDPNDDQTVWTFQEYTSASNTWAIRAIQLKAPLPATPSTASPSVICQGQNPVSVTITGTSVSGSEFFDPGPDTGGPGYLNHISASLAGGTPPAVTGVTFTDPTHITLSLNASSASAGAKNVSVTNPDGQIATGSSVLTVSAVPSAPSASSNTPLCEGQTLFLFASTVAGATYSWTGPNGFAASTQSPSISPATPAASGIYAVTATVNGCTSSHGTTTAIVNAAPAAPSASNGGPICAGATLQLFASTVAAATYSWTGPNGFVSNQQNPAIPAATAAATGVYSVTVTVSGCPSPAGTTSATVVATVPARALRLSARPAINATPPERATRRTAPARTRRLRTEPGAATGTRALRPTCANRAPA
jgi:hypothetical protein